MSTPPPSSSIKYCCPACNSDSVQRLSVAFQHGTSISQSSSTGTGVALGREGAAFGVGTASTTTTNVTLLAAKASPPMPRRTGWALTLSAVGLLMLFIAFRYNLGGKSFWSSFGYGIAFAGTGLFWLHCARRWNRTELPRRQLVWRNSWHCFKCGNIFLIEE